VRATARASVFSGKPESVEARRKRRVAVSDVQSERDHTDAARLSERRDPERVSGAHYDGGAALHGGFVFGENVSGLASVRATCRDWRFSAKTRAAWQPRRTASAARENSGA